MGLILAKICAALHSVELLIENLYEGVSVSVGLTTFAGWIAIVLGAIALLVTVSGRQASSGGLRPIHWVAVTLTVGLALVGSLLAGWYEGTVGGGLLAASLIVLAIRLHSRRGESGEVSEPYEGR